LRLRDFNKNRSLFDALRFGIVSGISSLEGKDKKELSAILSENLDNKDAVILISEEKKPAKEFGFLLKKPVLSQEFKDLDSAQARRFLQEASKERDLKLDRESQELLIKVYEGNVWGLVTELDKLALLNKREVSYEMLKSHSDLSFLANVYSTIHEMRNSRRIERRLSLLEQSMLRNVDSGMIFNIFSTFLKDLAERVRAADYDVLVKSGRLEYQEALFALLLN